MIEVKGKYSNAKIMIDDVEQSCMSQIIEFINHPAFTNPVAIMSDCHAGSGSCVGFTMPMTEKIIPNIIGVDISCGMLGVNIGKDLKFPLPEIDHKIRQRVPFGFVIHDRAAINMEKEFPWKTANINAQKFALAYQEKFGYGVDMPHFDIDWFRNKCIAIGCDLGRAIKSIGTLGGGNHMIELGLSSSGDYWVLIHTGSRNLGKCVCEYWQDLAIKKVKQHGKEETQQAIRELKETYKGKELYDKIRAFKSAPPAAVQNIPYCVDELRWLEGKDAQGYLFDMVFAQAYAEENRHRIMQAILGIFKIDPTDILETVHNFIDFKDFIIRKGAVRSYEGERFILPLNMRDGFLICSGKSQSEWNYSAPHGAGRTMSRGQAKKHINMEEFKEQMKDIFSTSVCPETLDEAPNAYKDTKIIEEAITPTAEILDRIKPVLNMKDSKGKD